MSEIQVTQDGDRRIFSVDIGNMPPEEAIIHLKRLMKERAIKDLDNK